MQSQDAEWFLAKANEAEENAAKAPSTITRNGWLNIANGYRELARKRGAIDQPANAEKAP
jgi:hypothetical protein